MHRVPKDKGWAWVVLLGTFITFFLTGGTFRLLGVMFVEIIDFYNSSSTLSAVMFGSSMFASLITMALYPVLDRLLTKRAMSCVGSLLVTLGLSSIYFSPNILVFTLSLGITFGIENTVILMCSMAVITEYFDKKVSLASGLAFAGGSAGQLALPQLFAFLLETFGTRSAIMLIGAVNLNLCVGSMLFRPLSFYKQQHPDNDRESDASEKPSLAANFKSLCSMKRFHVFNLGRSFSLISYTCFMFFVVPYAASEGLDTRQTALMLTIMGGLDLCFKPLHGAAVTKMKWDSSVYTGAVTILGSVVIVVCVLVPSLVLTMTVGFISTSLFGPITAFSGVMTQDCVGPGLFAEAMALVMMPSTVVLIVLPIMFGKIYDMLRSYTPQMLFSAGCGVVGGIFTIASRWKTSTKPKQPTQLELKEDGGHEAT